MEIRVLQYFLAVAREQNISKAAELLHITQPTLSRQIKDLEEELGKQLLIRGNRKITLTEDGMLLRRRADEIVHLADMTIAEMAVSQEIHGDIYIGGGETDGMRILAKIIYNIQKEYPHIHFHLYSGNAEGVTERLDKGLLEFGVLIEPADISKYDFIHLPATDTWGVLMRKDSPLAKQEFIRPQDLRNLPLICSNQGMVRNEIAGWFSGDTSKLNFAATYNLIFNASLLVEEGVGYALTLEHLIHTGTDSSLCFRPLLPKLEVGLVLVWKKYQIFTKAAELFLKEINRSI